MAEAKLILVLSVGPVFAKKVEERMEAGNHRVETDADGTILTYDWLRRLRTRTPDLIIIGEWDQPQGRQLLIERLRVVYNKGPILACDPCPNVQKLLEAAGATRTCEPSQWIVPAHELLGLMVEE